MIETERTPSQDRGDIQAGVTRDKTPGFDPAAAPQETDAEAAGTPSPASPVAPREPDFTNQASFANAMQPMEGEPRLQLRKNWPVLVIAAIVALAAAVFLMAAMLR